MSTITEISEFYTPSELATKWKVSPSTIRRLCGTGKLRHMKINSDYRIPEHGVREYEQKNMISGIIINNQQYRSTTK